MITIMRIIILMYVFMRCRRAIGDDVNEWDVAGVGLSKRKQSRDGRLIWACLSKCKQVLPRAAKGLICTCFTCRGGSGRLTCAHFTCPGGSGEGQRPTTYETGWVRSRRTSRVREGEGGQGNGVADLLTFLMPDANMHAESLYFNFFGQSGVYSILYSMDFWGLKKSISLFLF